jgi:predicted ATPase
VIKEVSIKNFKSVQDLTLPLSRFNVLIGSNGSGKSNILEAIAFGAAASADKLDNEFLGSRGIRTSSASLMKSAFTPDLSLKPITLEFKENGHSISFNIEAEEERPILKWIVAEKSALAKHISKNLLSFITKDIENQKDRDLNKLASTLKDLFAAEDKESFIQFAKTILGPSSFAVLYKETFYNEFLANFIIYSPEINSLRKFEEESQIKPLGIKGEGLFSLLQIFNENESYGQKTIDEIKKYLHVIEWFDDFETSYEKAYERRALSIKDRFIQSISLNQNNVNEGFLFMLFYICLIISKETPSFFAIDNLEASFHPKLCEDLTKNLIELCEHHNKQIILTTHNPFVLDGLNLNDNNQSLFVVRRNSEGETIADKIENQPKNVKLSEAWMRGYIGGQPETIE